MIKWQDKPIANAKLMVACVKSPQNQRTPLEEKFAAAAAKIEAQSR